MKFPLLTIAVIFISSLNLFSQHCGSQTHYEKQISNNPSFEKNRIEIKKNIESLLSYKELNGDTIIIPVVFHIIHNGDPVGEMENLSVGLISEQLEQLNDDFSRNNADAGSTPAPFAAVAANTRIQFCIAEVAPNGADTVAIVRHNINDMPTVNESDCWTPEYIDENIIEPTIWDRDRYMNIYSVVGIDELQNGSCNFFNTLGYAQFPGGNAETDAVVLSFFTIGSLATPNPLIPQFTGRTATHEVGHWLDLDHPWGIASGACVLDDGFDDTPTQLNEEFDCLTFPALDLCSSSGDGIMFMNFMQYVPDTCMNLFTIEQSDWMRSLVMTERSSLLTAQCKASPLSIEYIDGLVGRQIDDYITIDWQMLDFPIDGKIILEHSINGRDFKEIYETQTVSESGSYNYIHTRPNPGINYYRLAYSSGVSLEYSRRISVDYDAEVKILLSPIPATNELQLDVPHSHVGTNWVVQSIHGQALGEGIVESESIQIDVSSFPAGIYLLTLEYNSEVKALKWIKQ